MFKEKTQGEMDWFGFGFVSRFGQTRLGKPASGKAEDDVDVGGFAIWRGELFGRDVLVCMCMCMYSLFVKAR